jgi:cardiolipin synthase
MSLPRVADGAAGDVTDQRTSGPARSRTAAGLRRLAGAIVIVVLAAACASSGVSDDLRWRGPSAAFLRGGTLVLRYGEADDDLRLVAHWAADPVPEGSHAYRAAPLEWVEETPDDADVVHPENAVEVRERAEWDEVVATVMLELAPRGDDEAALTLVQGEPIVFRMLPGGELRVHRSSDVPAGTRVTCVVAESAFAARAHEVLRSRYGDAGRVVFRTGDETGGENFVLLDLPGRQSVLLAASPGIPPSEIETLLRMLLHAPETLVLRGHVVAVLTRPVSSVRRLAWVMSQTAEVMVPHSTSGSAGTPPPVADGPGMDLDGWEAALDGMDLPPRSSGTIEPLIDGEAYFTQLTQAIVDARESVSVRLYIFDSDAYALRIADLLRFRSQEIRVRVLIDALGSMAAGQDRPAGASAGGPGFSTTSYLASGSGVEVRESPNPWFTSDHTKTILVDGRRAFLGGMNIGHEYRRVWHDMMVAVEGPVVGRLQRDFELAWAHAGLGGDLAYALEALAPDRSDAGPARTDHVPLRPLYTKIWDPQILRAQTEAMRRARRRIWVEQPYLADDSMIGAMIEARERGVDVRVVLPTRGDSGFMNSANLIAAAALVRRGVRVYVYPGMTHVKAAVYDGWACVGSANFDKLSLRVNQETDLGTSDPGFVGRLCRELFETDFARSREMTGPPPVGWDTYIAAFVATQL